MKKQIFLLFILCTLIFSIAKSQSSKRYIYYLDATLSSVEKSKAVVLGEGSYENGAFRLNCYSMNRDKLYLTAFCTDSTLSEFNGLFTSFHLNGNKAEEGNYKNGIAFKESWIQLFIYKISPPYQQLFPIIRMELSVIIQQKIACWILTARSRILKKV